MVSAADNAFDVKAECARVHKVYPTLMLATMLEGPMNCGSSDDGSDPVDCAVNETPEEAAAHAGRYAIRQHQENAYKPADAACTAWEKDRTPAASLIEAAKAAIATARGADNWRPEKKQGAE
jgi:hypothetical protein